MLSQRGASSQECFHQNTSVLGPAAVQGFSKRPVYGLLVSGLLTAAREVGLGAGGVLCRRLAERQLCGFEHL